MKEFKAKAKVERRMTRDGAVEVNKATGEIANISARKAATALGGADAAEQLGGGKVSVIAKKPGRAATYAAHRKVSEAEDGNVGTEAAHRTEEAAEQGGKAVMDRRRDSLVKQSQAAAVNKEGVKAKATTGGKGKPGKTTSKAASNPISKAAQKKSIKRQYVAALRGSGTSKVKDVAATAKATTAKAKEAAGKTGAFVRRHWKGVGAALGIVVLVALAFSALSTCGSMIQSGFEAIITTSYTSEDSDIEATERNYAALESALSNRIDNIEGEYPGYDEYRYDLVGIGHDPFELASYLTARFQTYTPAMASTELSRLFNQQYRLTLTPVTETRYRTETRTGYRTEQRTGYRTETRTGYRTEERTGYRYQRNPDGNGYIRVEYTYTTEVPYTYTENVPYTYTVQVPYSYTTEVPYSYHILNVKLTNRSLAAVATGNMTTEQSEMYAIYMQTRGNKPELFASNPYVSRGAYTDYDIPPEALSDTRFAQMIREAEKYLGYPYVWGGSTPSTSFDCSGYVSWVINHSGWDMGRLTAQGLMDRCAIIRSSEARPGDLIFFQGTYEVAGASHIGIYVGGNMMIHCGSPISYASVNTPYWQSHFLAYGRLP
jgi:cell wall-associated NlpC family hydrolase